ncbi:MAG: hypothetical protein ACXWPI_19285 [Ktedonobacterales bacterium]
MAGTNNANSIKAFIHTKLLKPAYAVLLVSVILRGVIGLIAASLVAYSRWPVFIRLPLELLVFLGVICSGEIIFSASSTARAALKQQRAAMASEEFTAPRGLHGKKDDVTAQIGQLMAAFDKAKAARVAALDEEIREEHRMMWFSGVISTIYGINFAVQSALPAQWAGAAAVDSAFTVIIELASIVTVPVVIYYFSARLHEEKADLGAISEGIVNGAVEQRLGVAGERVQGGEYDATDVDLLDATLPDTHPYKRLVKKLRKTEHEGVWLTTKEIFLSFGIVDAGAQRTMRQRLSKLPPALAHKDEVTKEWRISEQAVGRLLRGLVNASQPVSGTPAETARKRPPRKPAIRQAAITLVPEKFLKDSGRDVADSESVAG